MISLAHIKPLNRWDHDSIRPGNVGAVGETFLATRLKSSLPGDFRWDPMTYGQKSSRLGTNTKQGDDPNYFTGGVGGARVIDSNWGGRKSFRHAYGWSMQDLRAPDKLTEPYMGSLPQYSWRNKLASVFNAKTTGDLFPIPNGGLIQGPEGGLTRGGNYPRITDVVSGLDEPAPFTPSNIRTPGEKTYGGSTLPGGDASKAGRFENYKPGLSSFQPGANDLERMKKDLSRGKKAGPGRRG